MTSDGTPSLEEKECPDGLHLECVFQPNRNPRA